MGSMNKGSFKLNKVSTRSKMNNSSYNKNAASKYGNNKITFKEAIKPPTTNLNSNVGMDKNEENK
ncbi:MAG: hypothetical protein PHD15_05795 [Clostridia bacterium]|nr:hypothetical protein [Clostridia bacterium]MDD4387244.1 hypothetical protein [Clostridia bacterium]